MRVITGTARGRKLKTLKGDKIRPITDKVKEALFNIIQSNVQGTYVLDLYAGTGAIGIEALSRGAYSAYFIDKDYNAINLIEENLKNVKLDDKAFVYRYNVIDGIEYCSTQGKKFDIIFMDPPYDSYSVTDLEAILNSDILADNGIIILKHSSKLNIDKEIRSQLVCFYEKQYGATSLSFYRRNF